MKYSVEYLNELKKNNFDIGFLNKKTICFSGGTGLICSYLIDYLLESKLEIEIIVLCRNIDRTLERFSKHRNNPLLKVLSCNLLNSISYDDKIDYIIHAASNTDPLNYSLNPISTMNTNYIGTKNLLDLAVEKNSKFIFFSSCEVYGETKEQAVSEEDYGYINILDSRACYNESKRASETLTICYHKEKKVDVCILRLSRVYGPTMKMEDTKALSQFIKNGLAKEDIILKSDGTQLFNYTYVSDVLEALLKVLKIHCSSICFNVANEEILSLKTIAKYIANINNTSVIFQEPSQVEKLGYSKAYFSSLNCSKIRKELGWTPKINFYEGIERVFKTLLGGNCSE